MIALAISNGLLWLLWLVAFRTQRHYFRAFMAAVQQLPPTQALALLERYPVPHPLATLCRRRLTKTPRRAVRVAALLTRRPQG